MQYVFNSDISEKDLDSAYELGKKYDIGVLTDKDISCIVKTNEVIGVIWSVWNGEEYSFDIVVNNKYRCRGIGSGLIDVIIDTFNKEKQSMDAIIRTDVINPKMERILLRKGFQIENKQSNNTIMVRR